MKNIVIFGRVSTKEKVFFARQIAVMISSGVPLDRAIKMVILQTKNPVFKDVLESIYQSITTGEKLSIALKKFPKVFDEVFVSVVASGEMTGKLDKVLTHQADQMEQMQTFSSKIRSALAYPIFIIFAMIIVIAIMMIKVVPVLKDVFDQSGAVLPLSTRIIIGISDLFVNWWWLLLIIIIVVVTGLSLFFKNTKKGRFWWDVIKLKAPIVNYVSYEIYMARFARTIETLFGAGTPIVDSIKITARSINNRVYLRILKKVIAEVEKGVPMSTPISKEKDFPVLVSQMVMVGEQTGKLEFLMKKLADYYESEVDIKIKTISNLIEPVTIVIIGLGVGFLIYSILYPIYGLVNVI